MKDVLKLILGVLASLFKSRARLQAEILILRQQINVLRRRAPKRPRLNNTDPSGAGLSGEDATRIETVTV
jgi:hypothetical protein